MLNAMTSYERREIIERLAALWDKAPALRLGQLIGNAYHSTDDGGREQYYANDFTFIERLEGFYDHGSPVPGVLRGRRIRASRKYSVARP
jgi:hypothetical protein